MMVTKESLQLVDDHWAVLAIGESERDRVLKVANARLVKSAVGRQMEIDFEEEPGDSKLMERLAMAYEVAAIEGLKVMLNPMADDNDTLRAQCASGVWRAFELRRLFPLPSQTEERIFHVLHLSSLAYCGDRWSDLRRWFFDMDTELTAPSVADVPWDRRLLYRLYDCWLRMFRKRGWDDLDRIREIIAGLREDQKFHEVNVLNNGNNHADRAMAFHLIALYHWAKATELLAVYMLQGEPADIGTKLDTHFENAVEAAIASQDSQLEVLLHWLHVASRQMIEGSIWWVARKINSKTTQFIRNITKHQSMFELLPPQRAALQKQGLLDQASTAVVIELPTSGGKTLLAQFRMLMAINQFDADRGWVAYVAPTRALTAQITRRLRRDFEPLGIRVEHLTGAVEIDSFEEDMLVGEDEASAFDILVATPEKLQLVIRNKKISRPLALVVMDEAHNIENETRGLRIELLLATIKRDCTSANFLLLMPYVENAAKLTRWLSQDSSGPGRTISIGTSAWRPNERIVGMYHVESDDAIRGGWKLMYETLVTTPETIHLEGTHIVGDVRPLNDSFSKVKNNLSLQTAAIARVLSERGTSIAVANRIDSVWSMARKITASLNVYSEIPSEIKLVQRFLATEISPEFELIGMLEHGVAVHHSGLSDDTRALIEWLAEKGKLRVLCATTTIAQGINFPVSSVFLASNKYPYGKIMSPRDFWNLAGRAGRLDHDSVGIVGLAAGSSPNDIKKFVRDTTGELVSRFVKLLDALEQEGNLENLEEVINEEQWTDFRCYVAHLWNQMKNLDAVLADTEQLLRNTYGYDMLRASPGGARKARALLNATKSYAKKIAEHPENAQLADTTGFSPEGVRAALLEMNNLDRKLTTSDWTSESLFGDQSNRKLSELIGVMMHVPSLSKPLYDIGGEGTHKQQIANMTNAWVSGKSLQEIAQEFFKGETTKAITAACKAIYRNLVNNGAWGLSALSKIPTSGIDYDSLTDNERRRLNALPAMIYHGVRTEEAVLMRMNAVPRSIAERMADKFRKESDDLGSRLSVNDAHGFLRNQQSEDWERAKPLNSKLSGEEYKTVWELLSGKR